MKYIIAFPSISTTDFGFPISDAVDVIYDSITAFFREESISSVSSDVAIILVLQATCPMLAHPKFDLLRKLQADSQGNFKYCEGDICKLRTVGNIDFVIAIVNPSNHRFSCRGGLINQMIHAECNNGIQSVEI